MKAISNASRTAAIVAAILFFATGASARDIKVMTSGAFTAPFLQLVREFERATNNKVATAFGASMGGAPDSIPSRLQRGEPVDVVILAAAALDDLFKQAGLSRAAASTWCGRASAWL